MSYIERETVLRILRREMRSYQRAADTAGGTSSKQREKARLKVVTDLIGEIKKLPYHVPGVEYGVPMMVATGGEISTGEGDNGQA